MKMEYCRENKVRLDEYNMNNNYKNSHSISTPTIIKRARKRSVYQTNYTLGAVKISKIRE